LPAAEDDGVAQSEERSQSRRCTYTDNSGNGYMDIFRNGTYLGTF
jgi:hypothetical protein